MIEVKECSKAFGTVKAVNKATLDVGVREVFGLVGSNGAGKSTLLRMMAGIIKPDEGEIQIDGMSVYENEEAKKLFFYISDDSYFPRKLYSKWIWCAFTGTFIPQFGTRFFADDGTIPSGKSQNCNFFQRYEKTGSGNHRCVRGNEISVLR